MIDKYSNELYLLNNVTTFTEHLIICPDLFWSHVFTSDSQYFVIHYISKPCCFYL